MFLRSVVLVVAFVETSDAQTIAVYADSLGNSTCIETTLPPYLDLYILFVPGGPVDQMQGAQFRLEGVPEDWIVQSSLPGPTTSFSLGDPFDQSWPEASVAFASCQQNPVLLWKATLLSWPPVENHSIEVRGQLFCAGGHSCWGPIVNLCDSPVYTGIVLANATSVIDPTGGCSVAVESRNWGAVKKLYDVD